MPTISEKEWIYSSYSAEESEALAKEVGISQMLACILLNRGMKDTNEINKFLQPSLDDLHDPYLLKDMEHAVKRIITSIDKSEKILIYGDYDVDGVTSTAMVYNFLTSVGANVDFYIPDRMDEGYGLSVTTVEKILKTDVNLIITVDCGITSVEEVKLVNEGGTDIIITDHHECKEELPAAYAIINPHRPDCIYPFKNLAGVGVAFKLVTALCSAMQLGERYLDYIELAALGTVADVVPLFGENRIIVKYGLISMESTKNIGMKALIDSSGAKRPLNSWTIGFTLAPRINAAGRIGQAARAVLLFVTQDVNEALNIADELNNENKYRQDTEAEILTEALNKVEADKSFEKNKVLIVSGDGWHHGVIGIVASRITDKYYRPCIMLSNEKGTSKGSARSIKGFNIFQALNHCGNMLEKYGGHELAAGMTIETERIQEFRENINRYADAVMSPNDLIPKIRVDYILTKSDISLKNVREIDKLAPFGAGNTPPVFAYQGLKLDDSKTVGDNKHLKLRFQDDDLFIDAIGFNMGQIFDSLNNTDILDAVCSLEINTWNSVDRIQLNLKDIRHNEQAVIEESYYKSLDVSLDIEDIGNCSGCTKNNAVTQIIKENAFGNFINECINRQENLIIAVNSIKGLLYLNEYIKNVVSGLNYAYDICYTSLNENRLQPYINVLVNPGIGYRLTENNCKLILFGRWLPGSSIYNITYGMPEQNIYSAEFDCNDCFNMKALIPDRDDLAILYRLIRRNYNSIAKIEDLSAVAKEINTAAYADMNYFKIKKSFEIFIELGLIDAYFDSNYGAVIKNINKINMKSNLFDSTLYNKLQALKNYISK